MAALRNKASQEMEITEEEVEQLESLLPIDIEKNNNGGGGAIRQDGNDLSIKDWLGLGLGLAIAKDPEFFKQGMKLLSCFCGLQASYLTWGFMQELIMTSKFEPTKGSPEGYFPSAAFCVFSNRFLAVIVAIIAVKIKHGAVLQNNKAPLSAFTPAAISNTVSSWSQYASLKYVTFPVQTVFKSSKIIAVMLMGKVLKGTTYPRTQYVEAFLITVGVAIFSLASKASSSSSEQGSSDGTAFEDEDEVMQSGSSSSSGLVGLMYLLLYIGFDSFTSQYQDKVYTKYGRSNVDQYQMMLGVNTSAICITTAGLILSGDFPVVWEFILVNPKALQYNIITAITSATGQLFIFYTIKEFGPIIFTIMMITRQMISVCLSAIIFHHQISWLGVVGFALVFSVLFYQTRRKYYARLSSNNKNAAAAATTTTTTTTTNNNMDNTSTVAGESKDEKKEDFPSSTR